MPTRREIIAQLTAPGGDFALEAITLDGVPMRVYKNAPRSLRDFFLATRAFGERPFLIYEDEVLTYDEHYRQVSALAAHLKSIGVEKGDRVAIGMRNYPEWVTSFWACQAIGAIAVALNAWWTGPELEYGLEDSGTKVLIADQERLDRLAAHFGKLALQETIVVRAPVPAGKFRALADIVKSGAALPDADVVPEDHSTILYTSGTTGRSKGAVATHRNHVTNIMNTLLGGAAGRILTGAPTPPPEFQLGALQTFPFFHIGGLTGLYVGTVMGAKLALMYRWDPAAAVALVAKHSLNSLSGVPYVVRQLLESARASGQELPSLVGVAAGGAPVPPDLIRTVGSQFQARVAPGNGYGLTETTSAVISNTGQEYLEKPDSIGWPVPTCDVRVVGDNGSECGTGEIGEIWMRGPNVIPGYWRNPAATEEAFGGGWFRSGDLGYRDEDGSYFVVDRKKDMIIRGGENVYCVEVETALLEHAHVRDVGVLGLPHPELGEIVACVIQIAPGAPPAQAAESDLRGYLEERLAKFKVPARYAFTSEDLPRTATGKLLKRDMRTKFFAG
jgi:long-chain acyl-CoA synthetase